MITFKEALVLLGLKENFNESDLKKAYYREIRTCHPDLNPGDEVAAEKAKMLTAAKDILSKYLHDPSKFQEEESKAQAHNEAQRRSEERKRRNDDVKRQQEEARKAARENAEKHRRNSLYDKFNSCGFFTARKISREEFCKDDNIYRFYLHIYDIATYIMKNRAEIEREYEEKLRKNIPTGGTVKSKFKKSFDINVKAVKYTFNLEKEFSTLNTALYAVYRAYNEYLDYAYVLNKLEFEDLKNFTILDEDQKEEYKDRAQRILSLNDYVLICDYLNEDEKKTFQDIHNDSNRDHILRINDVRSFVVSSYSFRGNNISLKSSNEFKHANIILNNLYKYYPGLTKYDQSIIEQFIIDIVYKSKAIYDTLGDDKYNVSGDYKKISLLSTEYTYLERLYTFVLNTPFAKDCYFALTQLNNDEKLKKLGLCAGLEEMLKRYKSVELVKKYYQPLSFKELAALSIDEYNLAILQANKNKAYLEDAISRDASYEIYFVIYKMYINDFKGVPLEIALDKIKAKSTYIKKLGLDEENYELYALTSSQLQAKANDIIRKKKIRFIMRYNTAYLPLSSGIPDLDQINKEQTIKLLMDMSVEQFEAIYKDTILTVCRTVRKYKDNPITSDVYDSMSPSRREQIIYDIERDERVENLVYQLNLAYSKLGMKPISREKVFELSDDQLDDLDLELFNLQQMIHRKRR